MHTRVCPCCGYPGHELQNIEDSETYECPVCLADLYARPPRSYAEMEGLVLEHFSRTRSAPALAAQVALAKSGPIDRLRNLFRRLASACVRR